MPDNTPEPPFADSLAQQLANQLSQALAPVIQNAIQEALNTALAGVRHNLAIAQDALFQVEAVVDAALQIKVDDVTPEGNAPGQNDAADGDDPSD